MRGLTHNILSEDVASDTGGGLIGVSVVKLQLTTPEQPTMTTCHAD